MNKTLPILAGLAFAWAVAAQYYVADPGPVQLVGPDRTNTVRMQGGQYSWITGHSIASSNAIPVSFSGDLTVDSISLPGLTTNAQTAAVTDNIGNYGAVVFDDDGSPVGSAPLLVMPLIFDSTGTNWDRWTGAVTLPSITGAAPLPVFLPTNAVTLPGVTGADPLAVYMPTNSMAVNTQTNVGGFTLVSSASVDVDTTAGGIAANDVLAPGVEITSAVRATGGTGLLQSLTWMHGGTLADPAVKPAFNLLICKKAMTWPATNAACVITQTELTNVLGTVSFATSDFLQYGTNWIATKSGLSIGIKPEATSLFIYAVNTAATTNSNPSRIIATILQD